MNFSFHSAIAEIQQSKEFKKFKEKNKKAILFSAFFILTSEFEPETQQIDYLMPNMKEITTFFINPDGIINERKDELQLKKKEAKELEIEKIKEIDFVIEEIKKRIKDKPTKVILILQHHENNQIWNINCILQSFKVLSLHIDSLTGRILKENEKNIFDFIQVKKGKK